MLSKFDANFFRHQDVLEALNHSSPLGEKLRYLHGVLRQRFSFVDRIAVALYEPAADLLQTFIHSSGDANPLPHYQAPLAEVPTLGQILEECRPRLVEDLSIFSETEREHSRKIVQQGYATSYTLPFYNEDAFGGFVFFNSYTRHAFTDESLHFLDIYGHLVALLVVNELASIHTMLAALKIARRFTNERDFETGMHLDRMSRYSRLIAQALAERHHLSDEYVEHLFLFAPLHDIGKIGIPDSILLKPGKLTPDEFEVMKSHVTKGRQIIDDLLKNFGLEGIRYADMLRYIALHHHEALDGSGYPEGLRGQSIPLEARIVAVADIFDALTSRRPYKEIWSNDQAFACLRGLAGKILDADCVHALVERSEEVAAIQAHFRDDIYG
ncbi:MAG: HD domain-containing protein [Methylococcaceae bacterium]|nr:HD domain-containing protein [Methylococcaceae bacterium]